MSRIQELESQLHEAKQDQLFANFLSPGTLFSEQTRVEVERQDLPWAAAHAKKIVERHESSPYGFRFEDGNGKVLSGIYYLTGEVLRRADIPDTKENLIMRLNMQDPDLCVVVRNDNSFAFHGKFSSTDFVVDWEGAIQKRGDDAKLALYREEMLSRQDAPPDIP